MKKIFVLLLCAVVLFAACQPALPVEESKGASKEETAGPNDWEVADRFLDVPTQAVRAEYDEDGEIGAVLTTLAEKEAFFAACSPNREKLDDHYDEAYFADHKLVAAYVPVGSSSYWLGVESVELKNGVPVLTYNKFIAGEGTCDMAAWLLLAELPRELPVTAETAVGMTLLTTPKQRDILKARKPCC